jgi:hypothetical protein
MNIANSDAAEFDAVHTKWARIHELLALGLLSPDVHAYLGATLEHLEGRMWRMAPARAAAVLSVRRGRTGSGSMAA